MRDLEAAWGGGNQLNVNYRDPYNDEVLEVEEAATGSRQMLILLTHLLLSPEYTTCIIEEPECNLHPAYEKMLPALFAEALQQKKQLLVTTHSEIIAAALGQAVREGRLKPSDVKIWHLERKGADIEAQEIPITKKGRLMGWVKSFAKVEEELFDEWVETSPTDGGEVGS
jgi:predicted ATPase